MRKVLEEAKWCWGVDAICVVEQFHKAIDFAKSQQPSTDSEASRELRLYLPELKPVHLESCIVFHRNLKTFTEMMTGQLTEVTETTLFYFYHLSKTGAARNQHLQPIFEEIGRLRDTVETQRQIITSLGYRRLIEHLPNRLHYDRTLALQPHEKNSTRYYLERVGSPGAQQHDQ